VTHALALVNSGLAAAMDVLLAPFSALPPIAGLAAVSLATAVVMLLVFKRTSNQARLEEVKRSIHAGIFEIRLYKDDFRAIARAQREILRDNAKYLWLSVVPMLWVIVPFVLVIAQLQFHYGYAALQPNEPVLLQVQLGNGGDGDVSLETPPGLRLDTPAVRLPSAREVVWRVVPLDAGRYEVRITAGAESHTKQLLVGSGVARRSPLRLEGGFVNQLLYPSEPPLPAGGVVTAISVSYRDGTVDVLGWDLNWMVAYFALSIAFAFALRQPLGVTI
jgi:uncharacterized membrane protein (DUF106 family)